MKVTMQQLESALVASADALEIDLDMQDTFPHVIYGETIRTLSWFGSLLKTTPIILESKVDAGRGIVLLVAHLMGNLYCCLLTDIENGTMTMFLLDGPKIGLTPNLSAILPKHWLRMSLYAKLLPALKATYTKGFYAPEWKLKEKGKLWMETYLADKRALLQNQTMV